MSNTNGTDADAIYYTGFMGQSTTVIAGSKSNVSNVLVRGAGGVVATNTTPSNATLTTFNGSSGSSSVYYNLIVPANAPVSGSTYTVQAVTGVATLTGAATSAKTPINLALYGQVPARQDVTPGVFTDTVVLLLTF